MQWLDIPRQPSARILRQFAALWIVFFGLLAVWQGWAKDRPLAALLLAVLALSLGPLGLVKPALVQNLGIPAIVFGCVGMWIAGSAIWEFTHRPKEKMFWWYAHLGGMIGSYIAAWTAFSVVTIGPLLHGAWWIWIVPTGIGVPAIAITTAYYRRKFTPKSGHRAQAVA